MSAELLARLREAHAFDSAPPFYKLARTHVPFDGLTGTNGYEKTLAGAARRGERIALIGSTGAGKSSISAHVFGPTCDPALAPMAVRVDIEDERVATDPAKFAEHIVRLIAAAEQRMTKADAAQAQQLEQNAVVGAPVSNTKHMSLHAGLPWLSVDLAKEIGGALRLDPTGQYRVEQAQLALEIIARTGLRPVLILDDTDHWLAHGTQRSPDNRISAFFGPVMRLISESLGAASAVVAVHETYLSHPGYEPARGFLETNITLPRLPRADAIGQVLASRASDAAGSPQSVDAFIDVDALERLWRYYLDVDVSDLRGLLRTVHTALGHADDAGSEVISTQDVEQGID